MMLNEFKNDLKVFDKLDDEEYRNNIYFAYDICNTLKISDEVCYSIYQIYIDTLKKVTYEDLMSFKRLRDVEYFNSILELKHQIIKDSKIITFPKIS